MAGGTSRAVTIAAKWLDGGLVKGAKEGKDAVKGLDDEVKGSGDSSKKSGEGWSFFRKKTDEAGKSAKGAKSDIGGLAKSVVGMAVGLGGGLLALSTVKSAIDGVGEKAMEVRQAQALGIGENSNQTLQILTAYKQRGIGMQQLGQTMKQLAKSSFTAEQQETKHAKSSARTEEARVRQVEQYERAVARAREKGTAMPLPLAAARETAEVGTKAKAYEKLGIVLSSFRKLSATAQLEQIGERLTKMPVGPERTRIATELLGRSAQKILPAFEKGEGNIKNMMGWAKEFLPTFANGAEGMEKMHFASMRMAMAMEGLKLRLGMFLMPIILKLIKAFTDLYSSISHGRGVWGTVSRIVQGFVKIVVSVFDWFKRTKAATDALVGILAVLAVAWAVQKVVEFARAVKALWVVEKLIAAATFAWDYATMVLATGGMVELAASMVIATAGIALLVLGAYMLVTHWTQVKDFFVGVWSWLKSNWPLLLPILFGPVGLAAMEVIKHWTAVVRFFEGLPETFKTIGLAIWHGLLDGFKGLVNLLILEPLNGIITGFNKLMSAAVRSVPFGLAPAAPHIGKIPLLAEGGYVRHGGFAIVGDRGPEMLRLPPGAEVDPLSKRGGGTGIGGTFEAPSGDLHVHVDVNRREIATAVLKEFRQLGARA